MANSDGSSCEARKHCAKRLGNDMITASRRLVFQLVVENPGFIDIEGLMKAEML